MKQELQTICGRIKIKDNCLSKVREWAKELNSRKEESLHTLREEGVYIESVFLDQRVDGIYLIYFMKLTNLKTASTIAKKSEHSIDLYHKAFKKQCWETNESLELLVDFDRYFELQE